MTDIVDLNAERNKREQPDDECIRKDEYGRPLYMFLIEWVRDGKQYGHHIWAYDQTDADAHIAAMRESLAYTGQAYSMVPV